MRKISITILKDDDLLPLEQYRCELVGYGFTPQAPNIQRQIALHGVKQNVDKSFTYEPDTGFLSFKIEGRTHEETDYLMQQLKGDLQMFTFRLSSQKYWRTFLITSYEVKWLDYERRAVITLNGESYSWGDEKSILILQTPCPIYVDTPLPTPLTYDIEASENVQFSINDISITMEKGDHLIIDSYFCRVTLNGKNGIFRVSIYDFPIVKGLYEINVSSLDNITLKVKWRPRV